MAMNNSVVNDKYAIYQSDCIEIMEDMKDQSIHCSVYSPPFGGLYQYSSSERDLSNSDDYESFLDHYEFVVKGIQRITIKGRMTCVHCMDVPRSNSGTDSYIDFPGDIIRMHERNGFKYCGRHAIWKEPLAVRLRTMQKNLAHASLVADSMDCGVASADYLMLFRKDGTNQTPVRHPEGMMSYAGDREVPADLLKYRGYQGKQTENLFSHWIWRQYADCMWDDIRISRVLPYKQSRDKDDEKHVHPLQLDVIERIVQLRTNPGETVFTPFMGVGSEVYVPVLLGRKGVGVELKESYYNQAARNLEHVYHGNSFESMESDELFKGE